MARATATAPLLILACCLSWSPGLFAQGDALHGLSDFWQPKFGREPFGQVLIDQLPAGTLLINDGGDHWRVFLCAKRDEDNWVRGRVDVPKS